MLGGILGREAGGWPVGLLLGFAGLLCLPWVVDIPWKVLNRRMFQQLRAMPTDGLKAELAQKFGHFAYLDVLRELRSRDEAMEGEVPRLVRWLEYPAVPDRYIAHAALRQFFPAVAAHLVNYSATQDPALRAQSVQGLRRWLKNAGDRG